MNKIKIGVIFGGRSGEHEVSVRSAKTVVEQIDHNRYDVIPIAIGKDGNWHNPVKSAEFLPQELHQYLTINSTQISEKIALIGDPTFNGLKKLDSPDSEPLPLDVVFPTLHGTFGEDGTIQGLFEMANIPYVGCGVLASSCGMDKAVMKALFRDAKLPICRYISFLRRDYENEPTVIVEQAKAEFGFPMFVKPANLGSSVGVSKATDDDSLKKAIELAAQFDRKIIIEEGLQMREIECAVIGNDDPQSSLPGEYLIKDDSKVFLDYVEKYSGTGNNEFVVPAPISEPLTEKIREMSIRAFKAIDGSGLARVDFFLRRDTGELLVNEINTLPGLTDSSGFPKMWAGTGINFTQIIDTLVTFAIERHQDKSRNKTNL